MEEDELVTKTVPLTLPFVAEFALFTYAFNTPEEGTCRRTLPLSPTAFSSPFSDSCFQLPLCPPYPSPPHLNQLLSSPSTQLCSIMLELSQNSEPYPLPVVVTKESLQG